MTVWDRLRKNVFTILSGNLLASVFGLIGLSIITKAIGTEAFGFFILMTVAIEIVNRLFNFQTWQAYIKFAPEFGASSNVGMDLPQLTKLCFCLDFLSLIFASVIAFAGVSFFNSFFLVPEEYHLATYMMCCLLFFNVFEITTGVFRHFDEFALHTHILVFFSFLKMVAYLLASLFSADLYGFVYAALIASSINIVLQFCFVLKIMAKNGYSFLGILRSKVGYRAARSTGVLAFVWHNNLDSSIRMVSRRLDVFLLGRLVGAEAVGLYKIIQELAGILGKFTSPVYQALYPEFAKMVAEGKRREIRAVTSKIMMYLLAAALCFYCLYIIFGAYIIELAFGLDYIAAYQYSLVYLLATVIDVITLPFVPLMFSFGLAKSAVKNQVIATIIYVAALFMLIDSYQVWGACIAYIFFYVIWSALTFRSLRKNWVING